MIRKGQPASSANLCAEMLDEQGNTWGVVERRPGDQHGQQPGEQPSLYLLAEGCFIGAQDVSGRQAIFGRWFDGTKLPEEDRFRKYPEGTWRMWANASGGEVFRSREDAMRAAEAKAVEQCEERVLKAQAELRRALGALYSCGVPVKIT